MPVEIFVLTELTVLLFCILASIKVFEVDVFQVQKLKFPPHITYMLLGMIAILISLYIKGIAKINPQNHIVKIGKHAIFYYFGQGISSSILFKIRNMFKYHWSIKFIILLIINLILAIIISEVLRKTYEMLDKNIFSIKLQNKERLLSFFFVKSSN